jgi:hypothetical protein
MMGSANAPLELGFYDMLANAVPARLDKLAVSGQLDPGVLKLRSVPLERLEEAFAAASEMRGSDITAVTLRPAR